MEKRAYIAIDLKSFYASVECAERRLDPLKAKLVVADASRTDKTICLAVSPALKAYGIPGRPRLFEVKEKLREIELRTGEHVDFIIAPPRMSLYIRYSTDIFATYLNYVSADDVHVYSVDECFIDATPYLSLYGMTAHELAMRMIRDVLARTHITATAGIGTNLYLAKIAMDIVAKHQEADADGVRIAELDELSFREQLWNHRPLTSFWRIGRGIAARLEKRGIYTMGDLAHASLVGEEWLYKEFGVDAEILIDHAWGYEPCTIADIKRYQPKTNSISSGQVLSCGYPCDKARIIVREMTLLLVLEMVEKGLYTSQVTLDLVYEALRPGENAYAGETVVDHYGRNAPKPAHGTARLSTPTDSTQTIMRECLSIFERIMDRTLMVKRVYITLGNLTAEPCQQLDMFSDPEQLAREKRLQQAALSIQHRFGKNALLRGTSLEEGATTIERNGQIGGHRA